MTQPTVLNLICVQCRKGWLVKGENHYTCPSCNYVLIERVAHEYAATIADDEHLGIYLPDSYKHLEDGGLHPVYE